MSDAAQISAGGFHTCVLRNDRTVQCWGRNSNGQIGNGAAGATNVVVPSTVAGLFDVAQVSAGVLSTCVILADGSVRCWGGNANGQLGDGTTTQRTAPVTVGGLSDVVEIRVGGANTACARTTTSIIHCWGNNTNGQLGDGTTTQRTSPVIVTF